MHPFLQSLIGQNIAFHTGPLTVSWYGLAFAVTFVLGWLWLSSYYPGSDWVDGLIILIVSAVLIGGRLFWVIFSLIDGTNRVVSFAHLLTLIIDYRRGGMSWHGGLLAVVSVGWWYCRKMRLDFWHLADLLTPVVLVGIVLVRLANFVNGELPGNLSSSAAGFIFPGYSGFRYPDQLYEGGAALLILLLLIAAHSLSLFRRTGSLFLIMIILMATARFVVEYFRQTNTVWASLTGGQWLSLLVFIAAGAALFGRFWDLEFFWDKGGISSSNNNS